MTLKLEKFFSRKILMLIKQKLSIKPNSKASRSRPKRMDFTDLKEEASQLTGINLEEDQKIE
jgi:hypothetical protein